MELHQEAQLKEKENEKKEYEEKRHSRLAEAQQLEANETRLKDEYQRRQLQYRKSNQQQSFAQKKVIGRILSKQYMRNLKPNTQLILQQQGFFRQPLQTSLYQDFSPWLYNEICKELMTQQQFSEQAVELIRSVELDQREKGKEAIEKELKRRKEIIHQREEDKRIKEEKRQQKIRRKEQELRIAKEEEEAARLLAEQENEAANVPPAT